MGNGKVNRRAQRTREQLQQALTELLTERGYDAIRVQDITERANVGRTTFYAHFRSKEDLYLQAHFEVVARLGQDSLTMDQLLAADPPEYLVKLFEFIAQERTTELNLALSKDANVIFREMRQHAAVIERCLREAFRDEHSQIPFSVLANYLGGAQFSLAWWWMESHSRITARELAVFYQRFQRVTIQDALRHT